MTSEPEEVDNNPYHAFEADDQTVVPSISLLASFWLATVLGLIGGGLGLLGGLVLSGAWQAGLIGFVVSGFCTFVAAMLLSLNDQLRDRKAIRMGSRENDSRGPGL